MRFLALGGSRGGGGGVECGGGGRELAQKKDHCRIYVDDCDCPTIYALAASVAAAVTAAAVAAARLNSNDDDNMRKIGP